MCIKSVPREILQLKFSTVSEILLKNLKHYIDSDNNIILKSVRFNYSSLKPDFVTCEYIYLL